MVLALYCQGPISASRRKPCPKGKRPGADPKEGKNLHENSKIPTKCCRRIQEEDGAGVNWGPNLYQKKGGGRGKEREEPLRKRKDIEEGRLQG